MKNIRPSRVCGPRASAFYTGMNAAARQAFTEKARPAVHFGARRERRVLSKRPPLRPEDALSSAANLSISGLFQFPD